MIASKGFEPEDSSEVSSTDELTSSSFFLPKKYKAEGEIEVECDNVIEEGVNGNNCKDLDEDEDDDEVGNETATGLKNALLHDADNNKTTSTTTNRPISIPINRIYELMIDVLYRLTTYLLLQVGAEFTSLVSLARVTHNQKHYPRCCCC